MKKFNAPLRVETPSQKSRPVQASTSRVGDTIPHKNIARKSMPKLRAPNTNKSVIDIDKRTKMDAPEHDSISKKTSPKASEHQPAPSTSKKPAVSYTDKAYEDIFFKVLNPSPTILESSASSVQDESTDKLDTGTSEVTQSDLEDSDSDTDIGEAMKMDAPKHGSISKKTSANASEIQPAPSKSKKPAVSYTDKAYEDIFFKVLNPSPTILESSASSVQEESTNKLDTGTSEVTQSDLEDSDSDTDIGEVMKMDDPEHESISKKTSSNASELQPAPSTSTLDAEPVFRGFPKKKPTQQQNKDSFPRSFPSRRLDLSAESSEEWDPPAARENDIASTPAHARAAKRSLDYDETPVTHFPRKKSTSMKKTTDQDKENVDIYIGTKIKNEISSQSTIFGGVSDVSRKSPFSDKSNASSPTGASAAIRGPVPFADMFPESGGFPSSAPASQVPTHDDESMPPPSSLAGLPSPQARNLGVPSSQASGVSLPSSHTRNFHLPSSQTSNISLPSSQESSFSLPSSQLDTEGKLRWLLPRRMVGTWVQCDGCKKWRYIKDIHDPTVFPKYWCCTLSPDLEQNTCAVEEQRSSLKDAVLMIQNKYAPGSIVWARTEGHPWWPAIVDDDPDYFQYYWFDDGASEIPTQYHVVYFDKSPSRDWVKDDKIQRFNQRQPARAVKTAVQRRLQAARREAETAIAMPQAERLRKYGMLARFEGKFDDLVNRRAAKNAPFERSSPGPENSAASPAASDSEHSTVY